MIFPNESEARYKLILSYLLAELTQEEIAELDEEMLTKPESLSVFEEGMADLMDAYADGVLDPVLAARVEQLMRLHPSAQRQLRFARALKASRDVAFGRAEIAGVAESNGSKGRADGRLLSWPWLRVVTGVAAILLVVVAGFVLVRRSDRNTGDAARLVTTGSAPIATKSEPTHRAFTVILLPAVLRGAPQKAVEVPAGTDLIRFQALLPAGSTAVVSTLRIANADGKDIRVFSGLTTQKIETETYVEVSLPAAQLPPGAYRVTLADGDGKKIAEYKVTRGL